MNITQKNAIEFVVERKAKDKALQLYKTKSQKWLLWSCMIFFATGVLVGLSTYFFKIEIIAVWAAVSLLISLILLLVLQLACTVPDVMKFKNPEKEMSSFLLEVFNDDIDLINDLSGTFEKYHLRYAKNCYKYRARQIKERIGILVGAIEKVGIIPLAITGFFSYRKIANETFLFFGSIEWIFVALVLLYMFSIRMAFTAQWMEQVTLIYDEAIRLKEKK